MSVQIKTFFIFMLRRFTEGKKIDCWQINVADLVRCMGLCAHSTSLNTAYYTRTACRWL